MIENLPTNKNFFLPQSSEFMIQRLGGVRFFCHRVSLPGIEIRSVPQANPLVPIMHPGDVVEFDELVVDFKIDEDLINYRSIYDWIVALGFPETNRQYAALSSSSRWSGEGTVSQATVTFLDSKGNPNLSAVFEEAFPVRLSPINMDSRATDTAYATAEAVFRYTSYGFQPPG